ncbi:MULTISPECIES: glycine cleavage system aminomethyltransferase GcvT [Sphingobium]|jgi:aminomethyltransferase|uniref:glycine cleavage system aminomethyltransferase GcvT n=1 Tax=Sphingobium TaxID=165695 RepID=UPI000C5CA61E|nr:MULTISPECIES: glycine cleavage system aminomethyltransferase GcvT [Sphingobium]MAX14510.1 glycine cleavage system protein T [Sphingobium sp.]MEE2740531.1 glycine cleavage system aminomethyltransferase GcvT [Pseudomonadota bacterium]MBA37403.1 glycine cleavage system protein T [Sphingobium sp.]MBS48041.1 glycine cleavage system protein T [Sphingobium sp.]MCC4255484.1 glycine cleavage system aminomethyltransferase GcvT [Sphingobium lactosutens]|tara:strand:+ start:49 stop:1200 length:1152 start_codon:yes stop_codon:yes gene_type:complete
MSGTHDVTPIEEDLPLQPLPLDAWHRDRGARMVGFAGYHMPIQYEGIMAEHGWTREHAGLFDVSHMGQLTFTGDGVDAALEHLLPSDIRGLKPFRQRYSMLLDDEGGILDDLMVSRLGDGAFDGADIYMVVNGATKYDDIGWMIEHLPDEVTMNHMDEQALLALQGPEAGAALASLIPETADLLFMQSGLFTWRGVSLWISRSGYTGEDGFEISLPGEDARLLADALCDLPQVKPIGLGARDSLRLEAGLPLYGHDLTPTVSTIAADLGFAIQKRRREEGGFIGHARVMKELADGPGARRVGLRIDGRLPAREGAKIFAGSVEVGEVTSGGFAPTLGAPIAMGWVSTPYSAIDTALEIDVRGKRIAAVVAPMPFVPHRYRRKP